MLIGPLTDELKSDQNLSFEVILNSISFSLFHVHQKICRFQIKLCGSESISQKTMHIKTMRLNLSTTIISTNLTHKENTIEIIQQFLVGIKIVTLATRWIIIIATSLKIYGNLATGQIYVALVEVQRVGNMSINFMLR